MAVEATAGHSRRPFGRPADGSRRRAAQRRNKNDDSMVSQATAPLSPRGHDRAKPPWRVQRQQAGLGDEPAAVQCRLRHSARVSEGGKPSKRGIAWSLFNGGPVLQGTATACRLCLAPDPGPVRILRLSTNTSTLIRYKKGSRPLCLVASSPLTLTLASPTELPLVTIASFLCA